MFLLECECGIAYALRWRVALVGGILYWALLTPVVGPPLRYMEYTGRRRSDEAMIVKEADMWP